MLAVFKNSHQSGVYRLSGSILELKKNSAGTFAGVRDIKLCLVVVFLVIQIKLVYQLFQHKIILQKKKAPCKQSAMTQSDEYAAQA